MAGQVPTDSAAAAEASLKAGKQSAVCWVATDPHPPRLVWAGWLAGGVCLVTGGGEQELPGIVEAAYVSVTLPATTAWADVLTVTAKPEVIPVDGELWSTVAGPLAQRRLNSGSPAELLARWAASATLLRLTVR